MKQYIEAIIVSFGMLDLLSITLPRNLPELDHVIIVTKPEDKETVEYCKSLNSNKISVVTTDAFTYDGAVFNKGLSIDVGLRYLRYNEWVVLMDNDCVLIKDYHQKFLNSATDKEYIYGSRRLLLETKQDWIEFSSGLFAESNYLLPRGFCYGFHSSFHYESSTYQRLLKETNGYPYPAYMKVANEIDWLFTREFNGATMVYDPPLGKYPDCHLEPHNDRTEGWMKELPFPIYHLGPVGINHTTRKSSKFE